MKKLNGYRPTHRNKWLLVKNEVLSIQELLLLEFYADIFDFDKRREDSYGLFEEDFKITPLYFNCSPNTIRNWHRRLLELGFISKTNKLHSYKISCPDRYLSTGKWDGKATHYQTIEKNQPIETILQSFGIDFQTIKEKLQPVKIKTSIKTDKTINFTPLAIGSYKDELSSFRTNEDYEQIRKEMRLELLTEEDMKWIDLNIKENPAIPS